MKSFRRDAVEKLIVNCRRLLNLTGECDNLAAIERVILSAPRSNRELGKNGLTDRSYCLKCLAKAHDAAPGEFNSQLDELAEYFIDRLPKYSREERNELEDAVGVLKGLRVEISAHESAGLRLAM